MMRSLGRKLALINQPRIMRRMKNKTEANLKELSVKMTMVNMERSAGIMKQMIEDSQLQKVRRVKLNDREIC